MEGIYALLLTLGIALVLMLVLKYIFRPREKRTDWLNTLSPTLKWMNAAGSILIAANRGTFRYLGGAAIPGGEKNYVPGIKKGLWESWEIQGHEQALEEMKSLVHTGMRARYAEEMRRLEAMYSGYSEEELIEEAKKTNPNADEDSYLPRMLLAWRRYGENALLGWDVGRCCLIVQWCFLCGYLSMEEMLDIGVDAGRLAQKAFQSWEEMMESYLLGTQFWQHEDAGDPRSITAERWALYRDLWSGKGRYRVIPYMEAPFDLPLSKEVMTDKYGRLP
ncbi:MAG TPA: DUF1266 domain-containing protein [Candidatus Eisenbergiella merdipullorum]|uniref:DUF1266 domain-containing protein n=1 Tax=Candidatus Eisenbergiella merdipullorum TaxID=2838553 RepID=A0A9D2L1N7_9FIRM|nr:DUF1266 domain-containing protein [Candidatus Eisenbergiella merdipullorum]